MSFEGVLRNLESPRLAGLVCFVLPAVVPKPKTGNVALGRVGRKIDALGRARPGPAVRQKLRGVGSRSLQLHEKTQQLSTRTDALFRGLTTPRWSRSFVGCPPVLLPPLAVASGPLCTTTRRFPQDQILYGTIWRRFLAEQPSEQSTRPTLFWALGALTRRRLLREGQGPNDPTLGVILVKNGVIRQ